MMEQKLLDVDALELQHEHEEERELAIAVSGCDQIATTAIRITSLR